MEYFYAFTLISVLLFFINKKRAVIFVIIGCVFFLYYLPSIGHFGPDYLGYQTTYVNAFKIEAFPWVNTAAQIDSEPFYLWYSSLISAYSNLGFSFYMIFNFLLCVFISVFMLRSFKSDYKYFFWIMILPVIFPTIFYFLLRSSLSYFLVALGFFSLLNPSKKKAIFLAILFFFLGINLHSQYILITLLILGVFVVLRFETLAEYYRDLKIIIISAFALIFILTGLRSFTNELASILSFLPSSDVISVKIGHLTGVDNKGLRLTALLSIVIYPVMAFQVVIKTYKSHVLYFLNNKLKERKFLLLMLAIILYGAAINIAYFDSALAAGRLSRFSDYLGICLLMPMYFKTCIGYKTEYLALVIITVLAPILYAAVYMNIQWGIF
tara:strand:- start:707 stop:1852 length:1146 start_codon:yes stop_codon:yes gene_type:complete